jgi:hypothetical protein
MAPSFVPAVLLLLLWLTPSSSAQNGFGGKDRDHSAKVVFDSVVAAAVGQWVTGHHSVSYSLGRFIAGVLWFLNQLLCCCCTRRKAPYSTAADLESNAGNLGPTGKPNNVLPPQDPPPTSVCRAPEDSVSSVRFPTIHNFNRCLMPSIAIS